MCCLWVACLLQTQATLSQLSTSDEALYTYAIADTCILLPCASRFGQKNIAL